MTSRPKSDATVFTPPVDASQDPIHPDAAFAGILHRWIQHDGISAPLVRTAALTWLNARGL
jgi:hypothetical protein